MKNIGLPPFQAPVAGNRRGGKTKTGGRARTGQRAARKSPHKAGEWLLGKRREQMHHLRENFWCAGEHIAFIQVIGFAGEIADDTAGFGNQQ